MDFLIDRLVIYIPLLMSLTVHEWAHAWSAWKLGDDTAKMLGRVSLNPIDHIDPVGTVLLPLMGVPFGWAKPVPINPTRFRNNVSMSWGTLLTAAAGPISNFVLAAIGTVLLWVLMVFGDSGAMLISHKLNAALTNFLQLFVVLNVLLGLFNLIPIPPLDGSRIVDGLLPRKMKPLWNQFTALGPILLVALILIPALMGNPLLLPVFQMIQDGVQTLGS